MARAPACMLMPPADDPVLRHQRLEGLRVLRELQRLALAEPEETTAHQRLADAA